MFLVDVLLLHTQVLLFLCYYFSCVVCMLYFCCIFCVIVIMVCFYIFNNNVFDLTSGVADVVLQLVL